MGALNILKNIFLFVLVLIAVISAVAMVAVNASLGTALNEGFWLKSIEEAKLYDAASDGIAKMLQQQAGAGDFSIKISSSWIKQQAEAVVPAVLKYLRGETEKIEADISIRELKVQFVDSLLEQVEEQLKLLPIPIKDCSAGETLEVSVETSLPNCMPVTAEQKLALVNAIGSASGQQFPDKISVQEILERMGSQKENPLLQARQAISAARTVALASVALFVVLLAIIFLVSRSLKWVGSTLVDAGLASLAVFVGLGIGAEELKNRFAQSLGQADFLQQAIAVVIQKFFAGVQSQILVWAGGLIALGIAFIVAGFVLKKKSTPPKPEQAVVPQALEKQNASGQ